ncbi:hypothetical protein K440DRAFT_666017 [Wilcoxina mikolae CBS 423.85]|nr:hypothetical protein K440DRAFT_666017 [Wilcoxina mikolae CBS 423.85]
MSKSTLSAASFSRNPAAHIAETTFRHTSRTPPQQIWRKPNRPQYSSPSGDLKVSLQTDAVNTTYLVSSHQLCCASPVFRASLGPSSGFAEAINLRRSQAAATSVSDDSLYEMRIGEELGFDPTAMAVVLYVIHARLELVPEFIGFKTFST